MDKKLHPITDRLFMLVAVPIFLIVMLLKGLLWGACHFLSIFIILFAIPLLPIGVILWILTGWWYFKSVINIFDNATELVDRLQDI